MIGKEIAFMAAKNKYVPLPIFSIMTRVIMTMKKFHRWAQDVSTLKSLDHLDMLNSINSTQSRQHSP